MTWRRQSLYPLVLSGRGWNNFIPPLLILKTINHAFKYHKPFWNSHENQITLNVSMNLEKKVKFFSTEVFRYIWLFSSSLIPLRGESVKSVFAYNRIIIYAWALFNNSLLNCKSDTTKILWRIIKIIIYTLIIKILSTRKGKIGEYKKIIKVA